MSFNSPPNKIQVKSAILATPPGSPVTGEVYLLNGATPTGDWIGQLGKFARWNGSAWEFIAPFDGILVWTKDTSKIYHYNGVSWVLSTGDAGTLAGDVSGASGANTISKIQGRTIQMPPPPGVYADQAINWAYLTVTHLRTV